MKLLCSSSGIEKEFKRLMNDYSQYFRETFEGGT